MSGNKRVDFDDLKARADFAAVLGHYGLTPVGRGAQTKIRCPFHNDRRPSCSVNLEQGLFHCFAGGCGAAGNVLEFVHRMETRAGQAVSLRAAGLKLAAICGLPLGEDGKGSGRPQKARRGAPGAKTMETTSQGAKRAPGAPDAPREAVSEATVNRPLGFRLTLDPEHPYLIERGLTRELVAAFGLGHCARGSMAGRVCVPIENAAGELVAYAGRWAGPEETLPEGKDKYELPAAFHKRLELFNLHRVKRCQHLVVVEGFFGAIRLHGLRIPAVALMGASLADEQVRLLRATCPRLRFLTVLLDGDEPGRKAAEPVAARLARHWWVRTVELPDGAEPDTLDEGELRTLLRPSREG